MTLFSRSGSAKPLAARMAVMFSLLGERYSARAGVAAARSRRRSRAGRRWEGGQVARIWWIIGIVDVRAGTVDAVEREVSRGLALAERVAREAGGRERSWEPSAMSWSFRSAIFLRMVRRLAVLMAR